MDTVRIVIEGRIQSYVFGFIRDEAKAQLEDALANTDQYESIEGLVMDLQDCANGSPIEDFKGKFGKEFLSQSGGFQKIVADIESGSILNEGGLFDLLFTCEHSQDVIMFPEYADIKISVNGVQQVGPGPFSSLKREEFTVRSAAPQVRALLRKIEKDNAALFSIDIDDYDSGYAYEEGFLSVDAGIIPLKLEPLADKENAVIVEYDEITEYVCEFQAAHFDPTKLVILRYRDECDFFANGYAGIGSLVSYDGVILNMESHYWADKGTMLYFKNRLDILLYG